MVRQSCFILRITVLKKLKGENRSVIFPHGCITYTRFDMIVNDNYDNDDDIDYHSNIRND